MIVLGDIDGQIEFCRQVRRSATPLELPIILLTARGDTVDAVQALEQGANDFIAKPFEFEPLFAKIRNLLQITEGMRTTPTPKASSVFISYSHADKEFALMLKGELERQHHKVWIDEGELKIGDSLLKKITEAIMGVDYVLALISSASIGSNWVQHELELAMNREIVGRGVVVLPALLQTVDLPPFLGGKYYTDFRSPEKYRAELQKLLLSLYPSGE